MPLTEDTCRICGYRKAGEPWIRDHHGCPTYEICPACGSEAGYEDMQGAEKSLQQLRQDWIQGGQTWFRPEAKPDGWDLETQLNNIPSKYR